MTPMKRRSIFVAAIAALSSAALDAHGQGNKPTALELAQLPTFCYWQFRDPKPAGDQFRIDPNCGPAMNHYCYGLISLIRAKATIGNKKERMSLLGRAATDIRYTESNMKDYPQCQIRQHVANSKAEVLNLQKIYGGQPSAAK